MFLSNWGDHRGGNGRRWLGVDLHVHSSYSGGSHAPLELMKYAGTSFLDAVAISDHHEVRGAIEGQIIAGSHPGFPLVIASQEISIGEHSHFLLIGSTQAQAEVNRYRIQEVLRSHRRNGGATVLAHPWTAFRNNWFKPLFGELLAEGLVDGVELYNASALEIARIGPVMHRIWEEWVAPYHLAVVGGSDYHRDERGRIIGLGRTYVPVGEESEAEVIGALRNRRCVACLRGSTGYDFPGTVVGNFRFLGIQPWENELYALVLHLQQSLAALNGISVQTRRFLQQSLDAGCFQQVADWLG